jgi:hypothetical protein
MWQAVSVFMANLCQAMTQIVVHASITRRGRSSRRRSIVGMWRQALRLWLACPTCMDLLKSLRQAPSQGRHIAVASKRFFTTTSWRLIVRLPAWLAEWFAEPVMLFAMFMAEWFAEPAMFFATFMALLVLITKHKNNMTRLARSLRTIVATYGAFVRVPCVVDRLSSNGVVAMRARWLLIDRCCDHDVLLWQAGGP